MIGATIGSALVGAVSANKAAQAQTAAANSANATQLYMFDRTVDLTEPQRKIGNNALATMAGWAGLQETPAFGANGNVNRLTNTGDGYQLQYQNNGQWNDRPDVAAFATQEEGQAALDAMRPTFKTDPGYEFRRDEGMKSLERMAAARGTRLSGSTLMEAQRYGDGLASQEYSNAWNRLAGLSGVGQTATNTQVNAGQNYATSYGQNTLAAGDARASGYTNVGKSLSGGINALGQYWPQYVGAGVGGS